MSKALALAATLLLAPAARAEDACLSVREGLLTRLETPQAAAPEEIAEVANASFKACGSDRSIPGLVIAVMTAHAVETAPSPARYQLEAMALNTALQLARVGAPAFEPIPVADRSWTQQDERDAYFDLMLAISGDFLDFGQHASLYEVDKTEAIGCGPYPAEEASALAVQAEGGADSGEFLSRIYFLGSKCDGEGHDVAGQVAAYFAAQFHARADDPGYVGLTGGDIRAGLQRFLPLYLDGASSAPLFSADEVAQLMDF